AERVVVGRAAAARAAGADREVALTKRGEDIRERLKREHHAVPHAERAPGPDPDDENGERPLDPRRVVARPQEHERDERGREAGCEREEENPLVEPDARLGNSRARLAVQLARGNISALGRHMGILRWRWLMA